MQLRLLDEGRSMYLVQHGKAILEALLLASPDPLTLRRIGEVMEIGEEDAKTLLDELRRIYQEPGRGLYLNEMAGGYVLTTRSEYADYVEKLLQPRGKGLSHAALETLAIVAYRQPVTKADIEGVRGVKVDRSIETLLERRLIREVGRKEGPGRPMLYGTTKEFLQYFGLNDVSDLPPLELDTSDSQLILRGANQEEADLTPLERLAAEVESAASSDQEGEAPAEQAEGEAKRPAD